MPRPINPRLRRDVLVVSDTAFPRDGDGAPVTTDGAMTTVTGVCVQPAELTSRPVVGVEGPLPMGRTRANILFASPPPPIAAGTFLAHVGADSGPLGAYVAFAEPAIYRAEGSPIPPSAGMTAWVVGAERLD